MKLCIRAHDLGVMGMPGILQQLERYGIDGVQLVCYKAFEDIAQTPGAIPVERAEVPPMYCTASLPHGALPYMPV